SPCSWKWPSRTARCSTASSQAGKAPTRSFGFSTWELPFCCDPPRALQPLTPNQAPAATAPPVSFSRSRRETARAKRTWVLLSVRHNAQPFLLSRPQGRGRRTAAVQCLPARGNALRKGAESRRAPLRGAVRGAVLAGEVISPPVELQGKPSDRTFARS